MAGARAGVNIFWGYGRMRPHPHILLMGRSAEGVCVLWKPFFPGEREKTLALSLVVVGPRVFFLEQVINNVAQIVLEETAPGSTVWLKWRNVLHVVDIVCCCSILVPIMWSIRHLRQVGDGT